ncbi:hypothetical protein [Rheinheimera baltica]
MMKLLSADTLSCISNDKSYQPSSNLSNFVFYVAEYEAMQEKIELLEELRMAESQLAAGAGVSNNDARAQVLARINAPK